MDMVGKNVHGERHGPAFCLCCFVGWAICYVRADSGSVDTVPGRH